MHFGKQLLANRYEPWSSFYLDYEGLKAVLQDATFASRLADEIQRIVHFFLQQQGQLSTQLQQLTTATRQQQLEPGDNDDNGAELEQLRQEYTQAAYTLLHLVHYVDLNVTGLRKILKKHDKVTGRKLSQACFSIHNNNGDNALSNNVIQHCAVWIQSLLQEATLQALYVSITAAFDQLQIDNNNNNNNNRLPPLESMVMEDALSQSERSYVQQQISYNNNSNENESPSPPPHVVVLYKIQAARQKLQKSSNFVRMLATTAGFFNDERASSVINSDDANDVTETLRNQKQKVRQQWSRRLNLVSTFLHMVDYYIIAPTCGMYAARLGQSAAFAGLIIALSSVSALASTLLYSWWSTYHSYKSALLFAGTCQLVGCLIYAAALPCNSLTMVIVGRLIGGFGSARPINRRYIADTCTVSERTAASAAFVTAGALGTSTGPALAALIFVTVPDNDDTSNSTTTNLYWQVENAPVWLMSLFWAVFVVCLAQYYDDPPHRHKSLQPASKNKNNAMSGERQSLLGHGRGGGATIPRASSMASDNDSTSIVNNKPLWAVVPVVVTFYVYFCLKFIIESVWSSTAILTDYYFDWTGSLAGVYLALLGLLVLPANWLIAVASQTFDDRDLMIITQVFMLWGCLAIGQSSQTYSLGHFIVGSTLMFVGANCLEGPNLSLLSKTIPPRYRRGFFNVGLLATESGTLGRAMGGVILTLAGSQGMEHILNNAFGIMGALSASTIGLCIVLYNQLVPDEDDDDYY